MRLIDAEALKADLKKFFPTDCLDGITSQTLFAQILTDIDNAPTVDLMIARGHSGVVIPITRPHGKWGRGRKNGIDYGLCSICNRYAPETEEGYYLSNFCPNCGADMRQEE